MRKKKSSLTRKFEELEAWLAHLDILIDSPPQWNFLKQTPSSPARIPAKGNHVILTPAGMILKGRSKKTHNPKGSPYSLDGMSSKNAKWVPGCRKLQ